jgi:hypothetical protein
MVLELNPEIPTIHHMSIPAPNAGNVRTLSSTLRSDRTLTQARAIHVKTPMIHQTQLRFNDG